MFNKINSLLGTRRPVTSFEQEHNGDITLTLGDFEMKNKEQIMEDIKIMSNEYICNVKNQIKSEDAEFLRTLLNVPNHPFTNLTTEMFQTYLKKNADYGDSFSKSLNENGLVAAKVRLEDKFNRFGNLIKNEQQVNDESVKDTLLDMANYAIMTVMWMQAVDNGKSMTVQQFKDTITAMGNDHDAIESFTKDVLKNYPPESAIDYDTIQTISSGHYHMDAIHFEKNSVEHIASAIISEFGRGKSNGNGADFDGDTALFIDGNIKLNSENYLRLKEELDKFEQKHERAIKVGSVVKILEGHRAGTYDEVSRVIKHPLRFNLMNEVSTVFYFPEELELVHG